MNILTKSEFIDIFKAKFDHINLSLKETIAGYSFECEINGIYLMPIMIDADLSVKLAEYFIINIKECLHEHTNKKD